MQAKESFSTLAPATYAADRVLRFLRGDDVVLSIVVDVLRSFPVEKPYRTHLHVAHEMAQTLAPVQLIILTDDAGVARLAAEPLTVGLLGHTFSPIVVGPGTLPVMREPSAGFAQPARALLAALLTREELDHGAALVAVHVAAQLAEARDTTLYLDALLAKHPASIRDILGAIMPASENYQIKSPFLREWIARFEAAGEQRGIERARVVGVSAIHDLCTLLNLTVSDEREAALQQMSLDELDALRMHLVEARRWPEP